MERSLKKSINIILENSMIYADWIQFYVISNSGIGKEIVKKNMIANT